jgi:hypothetical protein
MPAIRKMMGYQNIHLQKSSAQLSLGVTNGFGKTLFLKGTVITDGQNATFLDETSSNA